MFDVLVWIPLANKVSDALILKILAFFFVSAFFTSEADSISLKKVRGAACSLDIVAYVNFDCEGFQS